MNGILDLPPIEKIRKVPDISITQDIDHEEMEEMVCPYCGASWEIESEYYDDCIGKDVVEECSECGMRFTASAEVYVYFSTEPAEVFARRESDYKRKQDWLDRDAEYIKKCQDRGINMDRYIREKRTLIDALEHNEKVGKFPKDEDEEGECDEWRERDE